MSVFLNRLKNKNQQATLNALEVEHLLNALEIPALLISSQNNTLLASNLTFSNLCGFTAQELSDLPIGFLFPELEEANPKYDHLERLENHVGMKTILKSRRNRKLDVIIKKTKLGKKSSLYLLKVFPEKQQAQHNSPGENQQEVLFSLIDVFQDKYNLSSALQTLLQTGCSFLHAEAIALYQTNHNRPYLTKLASYDKNQNLPAEISRADLITHMSSPEFSPPFSQPPTSIQKVALKHQSAFLVSVPLRDHSDITGVLLALGPKNTSVPSKEVTLNRTKYLTRIAQHLLDINHRTKSLEQNLTQKTSETFIESSVGKYIAEGIIYLRPDLTIQKINPAVELMFGYASQEIIDHSIDDIIIGSEHLDTALTEALAGIPTPKLDNLKLHHRNGSVFPAEIQVHPVINHQTRKPLSILIFIQDISEEEKIRLQAQQLEQRALVGQMNAIFAHEIRNPINNITSGIQLLTKTLTDHQEIQQILTGLEEDLDRLTHIFDTVLNFSKTHSYQKTEINLRKLISRILSKWYPRMKRLGITYQLNTSPGLPYAYGDYRALVQVFTNLITNAVQAMEETDNGMLSIKLQPTEKKNGQPAILINVFDTGPGIPPNVRDHIFEPFFTTKTDGTGLGLSISKQIIIEHGGNISVQHFPGGTSFDIILPALPPKEKSHGSHHLTR